MNQNPNHIAAHIPLAGLINARHLGGYPTMDGGITRKEAFVRCENPQKLTKEDLDTLYRLGIRWVIDLRSPEEVCAAPNPMAADSRFTYRNIPVFSKDASPEALTKSGIPMGDLYIYMLEERKSAFREIFSEILRAEGGVLYHCSAGKDRTGVLSALLLLLAGVAEDMVIEEYSYTQVLLAPLVAELKKGLPAGVSGQYAEEMLSARPEFIRKAVDYLKKNYGSAEAYLANLGFSAAETEELRARLLKLPLESKKGA